MKTKVKRKFIVEKKSKSDEKKKPSQFIWLINHSLIIGFLIFYFCLLAYKLVIFPTPFYDWDESLYIQTGIEMIERNMYLMPVWQGVYWLDKPPFVSLLYAVVAKLFFFISPEISTRILALTVSIIILGLLYKLFNKVVKNQGLGTLMVTITAFSPLFLQRTQTVNADVFVLLGWLGYILFFRSFWLSFLFLAIAVMTKSLIGFYPVAIMSGYYAYRLITKQSTFDEIKKVCIKMSIQVGILMLWYVSMLIIFGGQFFHQHIIETHFRRVNSSIEFKFGQRTFCIDLAREQFGFFFWMAIVGLLSFSYSIWKSKFNPELALYGLYLLPWFIFLNATKTKIFWYLYPALPAFGFLAAYPITFLKRFRNIFALAIIATAAFVIYQAFGPKNVVATAYSKEEAHHRLARYAKNSCSSLTVLMNPESRKSFATLDRMGLLITTTKWWGSHPSIVYYYKKPVEFVYYSEQLAPKVTLLKPGACVVLENQDTELAKNISVLKSLQTFDNLYLYVKN